MFYGIKDHKMQLAKKLSYKSKHRVRIGAVVVQGKSVVGVGFNKIEKTHPIISKNSHKRLHAEVDCIIGIDRRKLLGATIYVYRERLDGQIGMCRPCPACQAILKEAGVKKAYYTDPNTKENIGEIRL